MGWQERLQLLALPDSRRVDIVPLRPAISILRGLIPPLEFYEAIQRLRIVVILFKASRVLVVLFLILVFSCASFGPIAISKFIVFIVGTV